MNILLDYFFPITAIEPTPQASTAFLKQACIVVKPKGGVTPGTITLATTMTAVTALTDNTEAQQLFNAGMSRVYVLPMASLALATALEGHETDFFTLLISSDFNDTEIDALAVGDFDGVIGTSSTDDAKNATRAATANHAAFHTTVTNKAKNMMYAFGKMLSNSLNWRNQQYITMPFADDVGTLGDANSLFDDKINFVITDDEFGSRLALFAVGGKAIVAPYIKRNLVLDLQSAALTYISGNQPAYTKVQAALVEDELKKVVADYIEDEWIEDGTVEVTLEEDNFVAAGNINIAEPKALWRVFGEMRQTL
jgi:ATP adenylyltransferase/5',5'''-P-1,P-4-tetraphosphate phosphorylase II